MIYLGHSPEVSSILIHSMAESPLAENGELGESFFFLAADALFRSISISIVLGLEEILIRLLRATISLMVANRS